MHADTRNTVRMEDDDYLHASTSADYDEVSILAQSVEPLSRVALTRRNYDTDSLHAYAFPERAWYHTWSYARCHLDESTYHSTMSLLSPRPYRVPPKPLQSTIDQSVMEL